MQHRETSDGFLVEHDRGSARFQRLAEGVSLTTYVGLARASDIPPFRAAIDEWIRAGLRVAMFVDASALDAYETEFRREWTSWLAANRAHLETTHMLFRSRIVELGVGIVNSLIGGVIIPHSRRAEFEQAIWLACRRAASRSELPDDRPGRTA